MIPFLPALIAAREINNPALKNSVQNLSGTEFINKIIPNLITLGFIVGTIVALIVLLVGGLKWISSGGDREKTSSAQKTITTAVIGLVFIFSLYAILRLIELLFGIKIIQIDIEPLIL